MSWFNLNKAMGTNYTVDPKDIINTKTALSQLGYYDVPPHRGIDDWTDEAMFNGIRAFQKDNDLKVDGVMRPGGPTETAINAGLAEDGEKPGLGEGEKPPLGTGDLRWPGENMPIGIPPNVTPKMPVLTESPTQWYPFATRGRDGKPQVEGPHPKGKWAPPIRPPKGPY